MVCESCQPMFEKVYQLIELNWYFDTSWIFLFYLCCRWASASSNPRGLEAHCRPVCKSGGQGQHRTDSVQHWIYARCSVWASSAGQGTSVYLVFLLNKRHLGYGMLLMQWVKVKQMRIYERGLKSTLNKRYLWYGMLLMQWVKVKQIRIYERDLKSTPFSYKKEPLGKKLKKMQALLVEKENRPSIFWNDLYRWKEIL